MGHTVTTEEARASTTAYTPYAEVRETHTGVVVLVGDRAYKSKKPVTTDFLDYSTPEAREQACEREVELNRRLAPDSYLGVAHLSDPSGGPAEPIVVMRRYSDECRLATMVRNGESVISSLKRVAEKLTRFHQSAHRHRAIDEQGTVHAVSARWQENIGELKRFAGNVVRAEQLMEIESLATQYITGRPDLFTARISDRRIVDGHADLLAEDIFCLPGEVELLDCLEFDDKLRFVDVMDDAAFLAMDLEFLGAKDTADFFFAEYTRLSEDPAPMSLKHFYIAYRAVVRAKVDCIRIGQGHADAAADASRHLDIATEHLRAGAVRMLLIGGGPGTGKTTLAHRVAERVGAQVISTDDVRRELQGSGAIAGTPGVRDRGLYSPEHVIAVYEAVLQRAHRLVASGQSVILDGTWRDPLQRAKARELASETHSVLSEIACSASAETAAERVRGRRPGGTSDATPGLAAALNAADKNWREARRIDTSQPLEESVREVEALWKNMVGDLVAAEPRK